MDSASFWSSFPHDPRDPSYAGLRASDTEREIVQRALGEAYAEGRLDREEHDERSSAVASAKTLGELPPVVADLLPVLPARVPASDLVRATASDLQQRAELAWRKDLREAFGTFLLPTLICWVVWILTTGPGSHPWPVWVMLGTGINLVQTGLRRGEIVENHRRRLEKKQAKEQRKRELGP
ncbi:DUF1707 SHOCT-like domain-containing protein [Nocardioides lianchengensis]|uniref:DUF1707 domain-containing protein n=1 Tax=Nocardioides lianchengensis TaxID=1045774 RepID=A0A1G6RF67_9ACTN|nr:DUF1707 domain-containing protein [Nocardioides lianchengensis]NYG10260.1 hypothetical protein [Nocardioides lianchengensis]SDD03081.1 protein of unknown function [Nocardioides lianchengensis]